MNPTGDWYENADALLERAGRVMRPHLRLPTIPGYCLLRVVGQGGQGLIHEAIQESTGRRVAIKLFHPILPVTRGALRLAREAQILARLIHPGIAQILDAGTLDLGDGLRPYIVMEFVDGVPLTDCANRSGLDTRQRIALLVEICSAVEYAHRQGVIHRDLKPANILVTGAAGASPMTSGITTVGPPSRGTAPAAASPDGAPSMAKPPSYAVDSLPADAFSPNIKILDFGIARLIGDESVATMTYTRTGELVGSLSYLSPEQITGKDRAPGRAADVYALGVIAYELLSGRLPYDLSSHSLAQALRALQDQTPTPLGKIDRRLGGDLEAIVHHALDRDVAQRYESAALLQADLLRFLDGERPIARPPRLSRELARLIRRHRAVAVATAVVLVTACVAAVITTRSLIIADRSLAENHRLSDSGEILALEREVERLATDPANAPLFEDWLRRAEALSRRLPQHRQAIERLRVRGQEASDQAGMSTAAYRFADTADQQQYDVLATLVSTLERFANPDPAVGAVARVRKQLSEARTLRGRSIDAREQAWQEVVASVAKPHDPTYQGLALTPQLGLVPIGRDPDSGLWEFAHLLTGDIPERDEQGRLRLTDATGLVLVLLPGGSIQIGAWPPGSEHRPGEPFVDPYAAPYECPVQTIQLDAFFISKYEMTQGQWLRATGNNPSTGRPPRMDDVPCTLLHPVESVDWFEADAVLTRLGLVLPTSAQWEYAARGGTTTPWYTGHVKESLQDAENLADRAYAAHRPPSAVTEPWSDGHERHAPVGIYRSNPFGLHDVLGNVLEWCQDPVQSYLAPPRPGDGLRGGDPSQESSTRVVRGGSFHSDATVARCSNADLWQPIRRADGGGVRPVRPIR